MPGGEDDRRHEPRMALNLIVRVRGPEEGGGAWTEVTTTADASPDGVSLLLDHPLFVGQLVRLQLLPPLPKTLGSIRLEGPSPEVLGVVRSVRDEAGSHRVGVMFLEPPPQEGGAAPPPGAERRREDRFAVRASFIVQHVDEMGAVLAEGLTVAENLSRGGAQLAAGVRLAKGQVVVLQETSGAFEGRAEITHTWVDADGIRRLHVKFLDGRSPDPVLPPKP